MASPVDTSVKHAYSSMTGAPAIGGTAGSLIGALDAFLVNGWGAKAVDSVAISNGVCRLSFASGKSAAEIHAVIQVSGATPAGLNGEQRVTAVANGWVEFKTALPDGAVTGSISFKMAPLGWEKVFTASNKAVYRPVDPHGTRPFIRIDDSNATYARVQMFESMTDVDTGLGAAPASLGGYYWHRIYSGNSARYWLLMGDSRGFYFVNAPSDAAAINAATCAQYGMVSHYVGDINSHRSGDAWCGFLSGASTSLGSSNQGCVFQDDSNAGMAVQRASTGIGISQPTQRVVLGGGVSGRQGAYGSFPARANNGLFLSEIAIGDAGWSNGPRGVMPGAYHSLQSGVVAALGGDIQFTDGQGAFLGKKMLSISIGDPGSTAQGLSFFDVTGPWRS